MSARGTSDDDAGVRRSPPSASAPPPPPPPPFPTRWSDVLADPRHRSRAASLFPPLSPTAHKGSQGRVAIFGGSDRYAGAPYYAARSALVCGVDLATVFCASEACVPIKCYSPELMVQAVYSVEEMDSLVREEEGILRELEKCRQRQGSDLLTNEMHGMELRQTIKKIERSEEKQHLLIQSELKNEDRMEMLAERLAKMKSLEEELRNLKARQEVFVDGIVDAITRSFPALHAMCIGPGLGRHPLVFSVAEKVILGAIESRLMLILDADALFMLSLKEYASLLGTLRSYERCVLTPNLMEMRRLNDALLSAGTSANGREKRRSNVIVQKGGVDTIMHDRYTMRCEEEGGLKRSGGIGDVLAGTITAFMAWNAILEKEETSHDSSNINAKNDETEYNEECQQRVFASWTAAILVKKATRIAFQKKNRSMSALDVIEEIGGIVSNMEDGLKSERNNLIQRTNGDVVHE